MNHNILKVIIPFDSLKIFTKIFTKQENNKNKILNKNSSEELDKKSVAFVVNKGLFLEIENIYDITDSWKISQAVNFIKGNVFLVILFFLSLKC